MSKLAQADRDRLTTHMDSIRAIEKELSSVAPAACTFGAPPGSIAIDSRDNLDGLLKMQLKLLASALACDVTRVSTVMMIMSCANDQITFPFLGSELHGLHGAVALLPRRGMRRDVP